MIDKITGGLMGLLVGDALGVPYEFHEAFEIPEKELIEYQPPEGFIRAHGSVPIGTWSDDGSQALCLLASLLDNDRYVEEDFVNRLCAWSDEGYMCVDKYKFDIGYTTQAALLIYRLGGTVEEATQDDERSNGNGSLMRVLPLALWHKGSDAELVDIACKQSKVTHGHIRSQMCCAMYVLWARYILKGYGDDAWNQADWWLRSMFAPDSDIITEYNDYIASRPHIGKGSGYVVDSLLSAKMLIDKYDNYEDVVKGAIALGDDTDTTACIAGGIAGIKYGIQGIPLRWTEGLRGKEIYQHIFREICERTPNE